MTMKSLTQDEMWIARWHAQSPGVTARLCDRGRPSSYDWIAARMKPSDHVLDVGCGDGYLLERIRSRGAARLVGLDLSSAELDAARARCGKEIELVEGRAAALPFEDRTFDCVISHLALMLMAPIEEVLAEIIRVSRPGGRLLGIVSTRVTTPRADALSWFYAAAAPISRPGPTLGDERMTRVESLRDLLSAFESVRINPLVLDLSGSIDEVWELLSSVYQYSAIPPTLRMTLEARFRSDGERMRRSDGKVPCIMDLLGIQASIPR